MTEILEKYGFQFRGTCDCAGPKTNKYKNGHYTVYWSKRSAWGKGSGKFRIKHHGKAITPLLPEEQFETEIKKYIQTQAIQTATAGQ